MSQADSWLTVLTSSASSDAISDFLESREILEDKERLRPPKSPKDEESSKVTFSIQIFFPKWIKQIYLNNIPIKPVENQL